ncbi:MAG: single-stranded DNA-binding protein, partial [Rhodanobacteraceae bacterium]
ERWSTDIIANEMQMLGGSGEGGSRGGGESGGGYRARPQQSQPRGASGGDARPAPSSQPASGVGDFEDDDIPF